MTSNALLFAWNRSIPGREALSASHFGEFVQYLTGLQQHGLIQSFDVVFLDMHGGDFNGFFLIRAETSQLNALTESSEWQAHVVRAGFHLDGFGTVRGATGSAVFERMKLWTQLIPT